MTMKIVSVFYHFDGPSALHNCHLFRLYALGILSPARVMPQEYAIQTAVVDDRKYSVNVVLLTDDEDDNLILTKIRVHLNSPLWENKENHANAGIIEKELAA
jgi:hypothetical protein